MIAEILALASAVSFSIGSIFIRKGLVRHQSVYSAFYTFAVATAIIWIIVLTGNQQLPSGLGFLLFSLKGIVEPGFIVFVFFTAFKKLGVAVTVPVIGVATPVTTLLAVIFLKEELNFFIALGTVMIVAGIILLVFKGGKTRINKKHLMVAIAASMLIGASALMSKVALNVSNTPIGGVAVSFTIGLAVQFAIIASLGKFRELPGTLYKAELFLVAGIFSALAFSFYNLSVSLGNLSVVFPLLAIQPIFVLVLSWFFLKKHEEITKNIVAGTVMIVSGAAFLTMLKSF